MDRYLPSRFTGNFLTFRPWIYSRENTGDTRRIMKIRGCPTIIVEKRVEEAMDHARLVKISSMVFSRMAPVKKQFG